MTTQILPAPDKPDKPPHPVAEHGIRSVNAGFEIKLKQGDLLAALRKRGWSQKQGADFLGISQMQFSSLINMRANMLQKFNKEQTRALVELTGKLPEDLFPAFIRSEAFQALPHEFEMYRN